MGIRAKHSPQKETVVLNVFSYRSLRQCLLKVVIASVIMALLVPLFAHSMQTPVQAATKTQAQTKDLASKPMAVDPTKLIFETVNGNYGSIYNVIQDKDGFLWLAGINGAIKYDGYETEKIYSGETVSALFEDSRGLIWMVVRSGVVVYDKETGKITKYVPNPNDPNALSGESQVFFQKTQLLTEDRNGFIWIATMNGLDKFDKKSGKFTTYMSKVGDPATLLDNDIWSVLTAKDGSLWVGTATGLQKFDPQTGRVLERYAANIKDPKALHGKYVQATVEDNEGLIWAGTTEGGLNRLDPKGKTFFHYQANSPGSQKIANNFIYRLAHFDSSPDLVWITTANGLSILNKRDNAVTNYVYNAEKADKGGLGGKIVHAIIQDQSGVFWLVVNEQGFLQKIDPGAHRFNSILPSRNPKEGFLGVTCPLRLGPDGNIWVNEVSTGIARVDPKSGRIINHFLPDPRKPQGFPAQIEDFDFEPRQKDIIWIVAKGSVVEFNWKTQTVINKYPSGTQSKIWPVWTDKNNPDLLYAGIWGEGLLKFNKRTGQAKTIAPDPAHPQETLSGTSGAHPLLPAYYQMKGNQIWLLSPGIGFDLFDLNTEKVVRKHLFNKTNFTSKDFETNAAYIDSKGRFWMGQNRYHQASDKFTTFKSLYGYSYPAAYVSATAEDKQGLLWNGSFPDGTLTRLNPETGATKVFTERDGISPGLACSYAPVVLSDGQIWMAGSGGVTYFYPDQVVDNPYRAPVHISKLTQGGNPIKLGMAPEKVKELTLNWNDNFFEFEMVALSYRHPEKNQYQYKLEGVDKDWYKAGTKRNGRYSGLSAGTYTLRVRGSNNDGVWSNKEAKLTVTITPPWWGTWWFRGTLLAVFLAVAFIGYRQRVRGIEQRSQELERQVAERTHELGESNQQLQLARDAAESARRSAETSQKLAESARQQAEAANRAKSTFLANMSHELRTPLNAVLGFSQLMQNEPDITAEQKEYLSIINSSGAHLLNLINNVLDISKIESGRVQLEESSIDLHQLLNELKSLMYARAMEKGLEFKVEQAQGLPRRIAVDGGKLRQVLINLIGNAIKYTKSGGIILRAMPKEESAYLVAKEEDTGVSIGEKSADMIHIRFEIEDTGPGIGEEDLERIFHPFVQLGERMPIEAGTGLGLAISKQYVELMGGRIGVESEIGKGSVFHFEIPVTVLPSEAVHAESRRGRVIGLAEGQPRYRILIAEDQPENRLLLHKLLEPLGFDLREADNGKEALDIFGEWHPDLIFMDIRMPVMDGLEATRRIKAADTTSHTKVVAVTAHALEEERREILAAGFDDFIRKPYEYTDILDALTKHLGVRFVFEKEQAPPTAVVQLQAAALADVPGGLLDTLEQALIHIDVHAVDQAVEVIRDHNPSVADALASLAHDTEYGRMLKLIREARAVKRARADNE